MRQLVIVSVLSAFAGCDGEAESRSNTGTLVLTIDLEAVRAVAVGDYSVWITEYGDTLLDDQRSLTGLDPQKPPTTQTYEVECSGGHEVTIELHAGTPTGWCTLDGLFEAKGKVTCERGERVALTLSAVSPMRGFINCALPAEEPHACSGDTHFYETLLHDADGERQPTMVIATRCSFDRDVFPDAAVFASDLLLTCDQHVTRLPVTLPLGRIEPEWPLSQGGRYAGSEPFSGHFEKVFLNTALSFDLDAMGAARCSVSQTIAVVTAPVDGDVLPAGTLPAAVYRIIDGVVVAEHGHNVAGRADILSAIAPTPLTEPLVRVPIEADEAPAADGAGPR